MTSRDFAYWLQGFFEISEAKVLDNKQTEMIKKHLNLVFVHEIDPSYGDKKHQDKLNAIHNPPKQKPEKDNVEALDFFSQMFNGGRGEDDVKYRC